MRLVPLVTALALTCAAPAAALAASEGDTGGATVQRGTAGGGLSVPGQVEGGASAGEAATPGGGAKAGDSASPPAAPPIAGASSGSSEGGVRSKAAQETQPDAAPPAQAPDDDDVEVEVPVDDGTEGDEAAQPSGSSTPLGGLAPTGLAVAAFALLGVAGGAAGVGLRRLAR